MSDIPGSYNPDPNGYTKPLHEMTGTELDVEFPVAQARPRMDNPTALSVAALAGNLRQVVAGEHPESDLAQKDVGESPRN